MDGSVSRSNVSGSLEYRPDRPRSVASRLVLPVLAVLFYAGALAIFYDLARNGVFLGLDTVAAQIWTYKGPYDYPIADQIDRIGQRQWCVPLLLIAAWVASRRIGSLRPLIISIVTTVTLNFAVGVLKIASGRESPRTGGPEMFVGENVLFPSGHAANVVFHYGLIAIFLLRYTDLRRWQFRLMVVTVAVMQVMMIIVSVYRHTHWFSDLVAGTLIGACLLSIAVAADNEWAQLKQWFRQYSGVIGVLAERWAARIRPWVLDRPRPKVPRPATQGPMDAGTPTEADRGLAPQAGRTERTGQGGHAPLGGGHPWMTAADSACESDDPDLEEPEEYAGSGRHRL